MVAAATCHMQHFHGLRVVSDPKGRMHRGHVSMPVRARHSVKTTAGYIGSETNLIMVASTALCLAAGRFGLAPTTNKPASAGLNLAEIPSGIQSKDPSGFNVVDVLALGSLGHVIGAGIILGLHSIGSL